MLPSESVPSLQAWNAVPPREAKDTFLLTVPHRSSSQQQGREQHDEAPLSHITSAVLPPEGCFSCLPASPEHLHFLFPAGVHLSCISSGDGLSLMGFRKWCNSVWACQASNDCKRKKQKKKVVLQALTWLKHIYAVGEHAPTLCCYFDCQLYYHLSSSTCSVMRWTSRKYKSDTEDHLCVLAGRF